VAAPIQARAPDAHHLRGIGWLVMSTLCFAVEDSIAKWLGADIDPIQVLFVYGLVLLVLAIAGAMRRGGAAALVHLRPRRPGLLALRSLLLLATFMAFIYGVVLLPLADAVAITFTTPLLATVLAAIVLKERVALHQWLAVAIGLAAVVWMVQPGAGVVSTGAVWMLLSALLAAIDIMLTRVLTRTETNTTIVLYLAATFVVVLGLAAPFVWRPMTLIDIGLIAAMGIGGVLAQASFTQAYRRAPPQVLAPFDYLMLVWGVVLGFLIWREWPTPQVMAGAAVLIAVGIYLAQAEARADRATTAE
jgi:drug/metabolite transporter (DMT)-like permease